MKLTVNGLGQELFSILVQSVSIKVSEYAYWKEKRASECDKGSLYLLQFAAFTKKVNEFVCWKNEPVNVPKSCFVSYSLFYHTGKCNEHAFGRNIWWVS